MSSSDKSLEAQALSTLFGGDVSFVHGNVPIIDVPSIEELASRPDWPERRADLRGGLRDWYSGWSWAKQVMHGG